MSILQKLKAVFVRKEDPEVLKRQAERLCEQANQGNVQARNRIEQILKDNEDPLRCLVQREPCNKAIYSVTGEVEYVPRR